MKPLTVRSRLYNLSNMLYMFCRDSHHRTYSLIELFQEIPIHDIELINFFSKCIYEMDNPSVNSFFGDEWPNIEIKTEDDEYGHINDLLEQYEKDFVVIKKYKTLF